MYTLANFGRKPFSRDKKKRQRKKLPARNAFGFTRQELREEQAKTKASAAKGALVGIAATALPTYAVDKFYLQKEIKRAKDFLPLALPEQKHNAVLGLKYFRKARLPIALGTLGTGAAVGALVGIRNAAGERTNRIKNYRQNVLKIKRGHKVNTREKYNFWHHV